jgi:hypothetical protein
METIHGAELVVLSLPEHQAGEYLGGLLTLATPLKKNWHWLRAEDYATMDAMLLRALEYAQRVGMDHVHVMECTMVEEYRVASTDEADDADAEGGIDLESPC